MRCDKEHRTCTNIISPCDQVIRDPTPGSRAPSIPSQSSIRGHNEGSNVRLNSRHTIQPNSRCVVHGCQSPTTSRPGVHAG